MQSIRIRYIHPIIIALFSLFSLSLSLYRYGKNVVGFYIVHPTFLLKLFVTFLSPFLSTSFKEKLIYVDDMKHIYKILTKDQLIVPPEVLK